MNILLSYIALLTFCSSLCMEQSNKRSADEAQLDNQVAAKATKVDDATNSNENEKKKDEILFIKTSDSNGVYPVFKSLLSLLPYFRPLISGEYKENNNGVITLDNFTWQEFMAIIRAIETIVAMHNDRKVLEGENLKDLDFASLNAIANAFMSTGYKLENVTELFSKAELTNFGLLQNAIAYYICNKAYGLAFINQLISACDQHKEAHDITTFTNKLASLITFHDFLQHRTVLLVNGSHKKASYNLLKHWNVLRHDIVYNLHRFLETPEIQNNNANRTVDNIDLQVAGLNDQLRRVQEQQSMITNRIAMLKMRAKEQSEEKPVKTTRTSTPNFKEIIQAEQSLKEGFNAPDKPCFNIYPNFFRTLEEAYNLIQARHYLAKNTKAPFSAIFRYMYLLSKGQHPTCKGERWPILAHMNLNVQDLLDWEFNITLGDNSSTQDNTNSNSNNNNNSIWVNIVSKGLMSCQGLENVPHVENVQHVAVTHNPLKSIQSKDFTKLTALQHLVLSNNDLDTIDPQLFALLTQLKKIDFSYNKISTIPSEISNLTQLDSLILTSNLIPRLDQNALTSMQQLRALDVSLNEFVELPHLNNLTSLETLLINNNAFIKDVPQEITQLQGLRMINLLGTQLARSPERIKQLRSAFGKRVKIITRQSKNNPIV